MKLADRTDLRPETIALYQQLEREHSFNPKKPAYWALALFVWPMMPVLLIKKVFS